MGNRGNKVSKADQYPNSFASGPVVMLRRKQVGNPDDYFNKNFAEYEEGFESKGKDHTGLTHILLIVSMDLYNSSQTKLSLCSLEIVKESKMTEHFPR